VKPETEPARLSTPPESSAYGYLLAEMPDEVQIGLWRKEIATFCEARGHRLALIFVDRGLPHEQVARIGFTALLDVLELRTTQAVVIPSLDHLSSDNHAIAVLRRTIRRTGTKLIVIDGEVDDVKVDGA
jgi:DNA invertase Pin-like site-specific DNA recombinase